MLRLPGCPSGSVPSGRSALCTDEIGLRPTFARELLVAHYVSYVCGSVALNTHLSVAPASSTLAALEEVFE